MTPIDPARPEPRETALGPDRFQSSGSELPVAYANPWGLLVQDLGAVAADLRLQLLRLWRRNRQGDLPLPGLWPRDLAPLFWPLLITLVLALVAAVPIGLARWGFSGGDRTLSPVGAGVPIEEPTSSERERVSANQSMAEESGPPPTGVRAPATEPTRLESNGEALTQPLQPTPSADPSLLSQVDRSPEQQSRLDLATALAEAGGGPWIRDLAVDPSSSGLRVELGADFTTLPAAQQRKLANDWQALAQGWGFERLQLVDRQGHVLGREARVGSGMILLSPQHLS